MVQQCLSHDDHQLDRATTVRGIAAGNKVTVSMKELSKVTGFLNELKAEGSPKLRDAIDRVLKSLKNGSLLSGLGVKAVEVP